MLFKMLSRFGLDPTTFVDKCCYYYVELCKIQCMYMLIAQKPASAVKPKETSSRIGKLQVKFNSKFSLSVALFKFSHHFS